MSHGGTHFMDHLRMIAVASLVNHSHLSVYKQPIRMKADVEGWFSTLHGREDATYGSIASLIHMLHERSVVDDSYVPVSDRKVMKFQKKNADSVTSELWRGWKLCERRHLNEQLLDHCAAVLPLPCAEWCGSVGWKHVGFAASFLWTWAQLMRWALSNNSGLTHYISFQLFIHMPFANISLSYNMT